MFKPVILIGAGLRNPTTLDYLLNAQTPILTTWMAIDKVPDDHPSFCGRPGVISQRAANMIIQQCTHLLVLGARLDNETVGYDLAHFAPHARKIIYDVDQAELDKLPDKSWDKHRRDLCDDFWPLLAPAPEWLAWCRQLYLDGQREYGNHCMYRLVDDLHNRSRSNDIFALASSGTAVVAFMQSYRVKAGQRIFNCSSIGAMGMEPAAIGAAFAAPDRRVICLGGDGGFQLNVQELEVAARCHLNVIFLVINNHGYASIRLAQSLRFGRVTGADPESGFTFPPADELALAYGVRTVKDWNTTGPAVCMIEMDRDFRPMPRCESHLVDGRWISDPLEDMTPKLDRGEFQRIMNYGND